MTKYEVRCSVCGRPFPVLVTDPSKAPVCCGQTMDAQAVEVEDE